MTGRGFIHRPLGRSCSSSLGVVGLQPVELRQSQRISLWVSLGCDLGFPWLAQRSLRDSYESAALTETGRNDPQLRACPHLLDTTARPCGREFSQRTPTDLPPASPQLQGPT
jgi:hypothetical protein